MFPFPSLWVKYHYPYLCHLRENIVSRPSGIFFSYTSALSQNYAHFSLQHFEVMILLYSFYFPRFFFCCCWFSFLQDFLFVFLLMQFEYNILRYSVSFFWYLSCLIFSELTESVVWEYLCHHTWMITVINLIFPVQSDFLLLNQWYQSDSHSIVGNI